LDITTAFAGDIYFQGESGTLRLNDSQSFAGTVSGLAGADKIDLADIDFSANPLAHFVGDPNGGTLTVTDGDRTARLQLAGDYTLSTWTLSNDGSGGTAVVDREIPVPAAAAQAPGGSRTESTSANIDLLTSYMASTFAASPALAGTDTGNSVTDTNRQAPLAPPAC
jgi:hypothetical protein